MKAQFGLFFVGLATFGCIGNSLAAPQAKNPNRLNQLSALKVVKLEANGHPIQAWIMDTESKRQEGMMFLKDKDARMDQGMIFVFPEIQPNDGRHGFWMHNTLIPLDIIYIGVNKKVVTVRAGKALDDTDLPPTGDYFYVLELKKGGAKKFGISAGTKILIPSTLKTSE